MLLGKAKITDGGAETTYYALLVRPICCGDTAYTYERVGAGIQSSSHFSADTADVYIV